MRRHESLKDKLNCLQANSSNNIVNDNSKKKLAILLTGIHYKPEYVRLNKKLCIDFRQYYKNIKKNIYDYFAPDYNMDTYIYTNSSIIIEELLEYYNPKKYYISDDCHRVVKNLFALKLLMDSKI